MCVWSSRDRRLGRLQDLMVCVPPAWKSVLAPITGLNDYRPVTLTSVFSLLLPSIYTNDCTSGESSVKSLKFTDDTAVWYRTMTSLHTDRTLTNWSTGAVRITWSITRLRLWRCPPTIPLPLSPTIQYLLPGIHLFTGFQVVLTCRFCLEESPAEVVLPVTWI